MKTSLLAVLLVLSLGAAQAQSNSKQASDAATAHRAGKPSSASKAGSRPAAAGPVAQKLAACKNNAGMNLIKREECVWSMCKGRWGRDGCPQQASSKVER